MRHFESEFESPFRNTQLSSVCSGADLLGWDNEFVATYKSFLFFLAQKKFVIARVTFLARSKINNKEQRDLLIAEQSHVQDHLHNLVVASNVLVVTAARFALKTTVTFTAEEMWPFLSILAL